MSTKILLKDLADPKIFAEHKDKLLAYFEKGGTWQDLFSWDEKAMNGLYKKAYDLYQEGDYQKSASAFSFLTSINPYKEIYWMGYALAKQAQRLYKEAIAVYVVVEKMTPHNPVLSLRLGECFLALTEKEKAREHLKKAIEMASDTFTYKAISIQAQKLLAEI